MQDQSLEAEREEGEGSRESAREETDARGMCESRSVYGLEKS